MDIKKFEDLKQDCLDWRNKVNRKISCGKILVFNNSCP